MILYYSGTGNSQFVAEKMAQCLNEPCVNLFEKLKNHDITPLESQTPFIVVSPTYGWQLPHLVRDWLKQVSFNGNQALYFFLTCGSEIGNASKYLECLCKEINMEYRGCGEIVMPENYIALFNVPSENEIQQLLLQATQTVEMYVPFIQNDQCLPEPTRNGIDRFKSSWVNAAFYPLIVHAKKFYANDACIGCGKCALHCVMNNIQIIKGKPQWEDHCTHCMACICGCPTEAIEYGKATKNKPRYQCPK